MDESAFEDLVLEAIETLPREFRERLRNVEVRVEDWPTRDQLRAVRAGRGVTLFGLYHGVPMTQRSMAPPLMPDVITIFREPLLRHFSSPDELRAQIRHTVL